MALSSVFLTSTSLSCVPQTPNSPSLSGVQTPHSVLSQTTSLMLPLRQARGKFQYQTLKSTNRRSSSTVKAMASPLDEDINYTKNVEVFSSEHLLDSLTHDIVELSEQCIADKGSFSVALSDTSSVKFLRNLVSPGIIKTIDWAKWQFFWVEEEVIVPGYQFKKRFLSNEQLHPIIYNEFLNKVKKPGPYVVSIDYELIAKQEASDRYETILRDMVAGSKIARSRRGLPKFDLTLLGMEEDGTVGSLIPDHPVLNEQQRWVTHVQSNKDGTTRLTLTLPVINSSSNIAMVVSGSDNANTVYYSLMEGVADNRLLPAKRISPVEGGVMKWYLDKAAASRIFKEELRIEKRRD